MMEEKRNKDGFIELTESEENWCLYTMQTQQIYAILPTEEQQREMFEETDRLIAETESLIKAAKKTTKKCNKAIKQANKKKVKQTYKPAEDEDDEPSRHETMKRTKGLLDLISSVSFELEAGTHGFDCLFSLNR